MEVLLVGINHRTAPVDVRERLACPTSEIGAELKRLLSATPVEEAVLVSTCNRVEVYCASEKPLEASESVRAFLSEHRGISRDDLDPHLYTRIGAEAVWQLFRVSSSLDSMVLGEPQILGQIKDAYRIAATHGGTRTLLNKLFHRAFQAAKRVRTETRIGAYAVSVASTAVELASKIFGDLTDRTVLLVGAGDMGELTAQHLLGAGVTKFRIANRTFSAAEALAQQFGGVPAPLENLAEELQLADIIIATTGAPKPIITQSMAQAALKSRKNRPMFFIDIAVPRDIEPKVNRLENAYLYDIDDLQGISDRNLKERESEAARAESLIRMEVEKFEAWRATLEVVPTIVELRTRFEAIAKAELQKALLSVPDAGEKEKKALELLAHNIIGKLLHPPTTMLKKCSEEGDAEVSRACRTLFCLENAGEEDDDNENNAEERDDI